MLLPMDALELLARYQTTLDNQLYKALRALREAQAWRAKTIEASPAMASPSAAGLADLAPIAEAA